MGVLGFAVPASVVAAVLLLIGGGVIPLWPADPDDDEPIERPPDPEEAQPPWTR